MHGIAERLIDTLKTSPIIIMVLLLCGLFWGGLGYMFEHILQVSHEERMVMLERCLPPPQAR